MRAVDDDGAGRLAADAGDAVGGQDRRQVSSGQGSLPSKLVAHHAQMEGKNKPLVCLICFLGFVQPATIPIWIAIFTHKSASDSPANLGGRRGGEVDGRSPRVPPSTRYRNEIACAPGEAGAIQPVEDRCG